MSRKRYALEGLAVYAVFQVLTAWFLNAVRTSGHTFYQDVLINGIGPDRQAAADFLRDGVFPTWTRDLYGGVPFIANVQHAVYYPGNIPWLFLDTSTALEVVVATTIAFGGFAMWAYCRFALRTGMWGAVLGGLAFGFSGVSLQHIILTNQLQAISWMPLVLLFAHLALEQRRLRWVVATALSVGMQFLAGHPEEWVYTLGALALYALVWSFGAGLRQWWRRAVHAAVSIGGAIVLFVLLFGWQLFPTLLLRRQGYRNSAGFRDQFPLPKRLAVNAMLPDFDTGLFGENVGFIGLVALALAGLGLVARRRDLRWLQVYLAVLGVFGFVMALGTITPLYRFAYDNLSIVRGFRVPSRYLMLPTFAFAAAAALGLDALLTEHVGAWRARLVQGLKAAGVLVAGLAFALVVGDISNPGPTLRWWVVTALIGLACWLAATVPAVPRIALALVVIGTTAVELRQARPRAEYHQVARNETFDDYGPFVTRMAREGGRFVTNAQLPMEGAKGDPIPIPDKTWSQRDQDYYRAGFQYRVIARPNIHVGLHTETVIGRDGGLMPLRLYREWFEAVRVAEGNIVRGVHPTPPSGWNWDALDFVGVRWFVTNPLATGEASFLSTKGFTRVDTFAFAELWERTATPLIRVTGDVEVVPDPEARLARLRGGFSLQRGALVEEQVDVTPGATGTVTGVRVGNTTVKATVNASAPALVTLADPWYPQWRVYVDGKKADLLRVDHAFRGVRVPAGTHEVEFRYEDDAHRRGVLLALLTVIGLLLVPVVRRGIRARRAGRQP